MIIRRISQAAIGLLLLVPSYLLALNLGDITLDSSLYQPLQATIPITDSQSVDMSTVRATLGSEAQFKQAGLKRSQAVQQLQFSVKADAQGKAWISVTSKQAIVDSNLQFIVRVSWPYGETMRWYTLKLAASSTSSPDTIAKMKANALADADAVATAKAQKKAAAQSQASMLVTQQLAQINTNLQTVQVSLSSLQQTNEMLKTQLDSQNQAMQQLQQQVTTLQTQQAAASVAPAPAPTPAAAPAKAATASTSAPEAEQGYRLKTWQAFLAVFVILFIILRMVAVLRRQSAAAAATPAAPGQQPLAPANASEPTPASATPAPATPAPAAPAGIKPTVVMQAGQPNVPAAPPKPRVVPITELRKAQEAGAAAPSVPGKNPLVSPSAPAAPQAPAPAQKDGPRPQLAAAAKPLPTPAAAPAAKLAPNSSAPLVKPIETKREKPAEKLPIVTPTPGDSEYSNSTVENRHATQLDLAQAYISMGDYSAAKKLLKEVIAKADGKHKKEAQKLLEKIPAKKGK